MFQTNVEAALTGDGHTASPTTPLSAVVEEMRTEGVKQVLVVDSEASKTPRATGDAGDSEGRSPSGSRPAADDSEDPHSSGSRPAADDNGTYWGFVSTESVSPHLPDTRVEVRWDGSPTRIDPAADAPVRTAGD